MVKTISPMFIKIRGLPKDSPIRQALLYSLVAQDCWAAHRTLLMHMMDVAGMLPDDSTYRICMHGDWVEVLCFGIERIDSVLEGRYDDVDALPDWVKERLAVLMVLDYTPPTGELQGVGRRISEKVFWVYAPVTESGASTSA